MWECVTQSKSMDLRRLHDVNNVDILCDADDRDVIFIVTTVTVSHTF